MILFNLKANHTNVKIEVIAGLTTFLTMSYVLFVNPSILSLTGMDKGAVFVATCLSASIGCILMGLIANYPIALAPGMGLNAYFTYTVVLSSGHTWQVALGAVFLSSILFLIVSILPLRAYIINCFPKALNLGIVSGIGLFLMVIGFKNADIIISNSETLLSLGNLHQHSALLAIAGFFLLVTLEALQFKGAIIISILAVTIASYVFGYAHYNGIFSMPPSIMPTLMQMDIRGAAHLGFFSIIFAFLFVDMFDNTGNLISIAYQAKLMTPGEKLPRMGRVLVVDSLAAFMGAMLGTSTTTSYGESIVGVKAGGRTGLTALVVGICFLFALLVSPLAASIPLYATSPVLIYLACVMLRMLTKLDWKDVTEFVPGVITALAMPLTFSIANGFAFGFISYTVIKIFSGRYRDLNFGIVFLALCFVLRFIYK
ncbi:MAG: NCS2 family permease [Gammaproteobacteria bacterium]|nr:NCS2 family permease [Gammaproteobacteria bacterium]